MTSSSTLLTLLIGVWFLAMALVVLGFLVYVKKPWRIP